MARFTIDVTSNRIRRGEVQSRQEIKRIIIDAENEVEALRRSLVAWDIDPPFSGINHVQPPMLSVIEVRQ